MADAQRRPPPRRCKPMIVYVELATFGRIEQLAAMRNLAPEQVAALALEQLINEQLVELAEQL